MKKHLNIAQRVEILLKEGVEGSSWAAGEFGGSRITEEDFLLGVIKEMREQIISQQESIDSLENHNGKIVTDR